MSSSGSVPPDPTDPASGRAGLRFGPGHRLAHALEFQAVFAAKAKKVAGPLIVWGKPNNLGCWRLGLSVGRRVGNAVARNRAKRLVREAFRLSRPGIEGEGGDGDGFDIVVSVRGGDGPLTLATVREHLEDAARRIRKEWDRRDQRAAARRGEAGGEEEAGRGG